MVHYRYYILYFVFFILFFTAFFACDSRKENADGNVVNAIEDLLLHAANSSEFTLESSPDSLSRLALQKSLLLNDHSLISRSYTSVLQHMKADSASVAKGVEIFENARYHAQKAEDPELSHQALFAVCEFMIKNNRINEAANYLNLLNITDSEESENKVRTLLLTARINQKLNQPTEQLRNLLDAEYLANDLENDSLRQITLGSLSDFYLLNRHYDKAMEYVNDRKDINKESSDTDSTEFYATEIERLVIMKEADDQSLNDNESIEKLAVSIYNFAKREQNSEIAAQAQSVLRSYYLNHLKLDKIDEWYSLHPEELDLLSKMPNSYWYNSVQAYRAENRKEIDSARDYFNRPVKLANNPYAWYNFYKRRGEFEERHQNMPAAVKDLEAALEKIRNSSLYFEQTELADKLTEYYQKQNEPQKTIKFLRIANEARTNLMKVLNDENLRDAELSSILAIKELERRIEFENQLKRHNTQYLIIALLVILAIMSTVFVSFYKVPVWWIKSMGYISFLMFFELLMLLIDTKMHHFTEG